MLFLFSVGSTRCLIVLKHNHRVYYIQSDQYMSTLIQFWFNLFVEFNIRIVNSLQHRVQNLEFRISSVELWRSGFTLGNYKCSQCLSTPQLPSNPNQFLAKILEDKRLHGVHGVPSRRRVGIILRNRNKLCCSIPFSVSSFFIYFLFRRWALKVFI